MMDKFTFTVKSKSYDGDCWTHKAVVIAEENAKELHEAIANVTHEEPMTDVAIETTPSIKISFKNVCGANEGKVGQVLMMPRNGHWFVWSMDIVKKYYDVIIDENNQQKDTGTETKKEFIERISSKYSDEESINSFRIRRKNLQEGRAVIITEENYKELYEKITYEEGRDGTVDSSLETASIKISFENRGGLHTGRVGQLLMMPDRGFWFVCNMDIVEEYYDIIG